MDRRSKHATPTDRRRSRSSGRFALVVAIASTAAVISSPPAAAQTLNFRQYTAAEGLPQAQVMGMYQDRLGYMWFATYGGLSRFDGSQFRTYTKDDGLSSNSVFDMTEDARGRMFIATSGGLCIREKGAFRCRRQSDGLVSDNARTVTLDGQGGVWVGTLSGLSHLVGGKFRNYTTADGLPAERVIRVVVDSSKRVWVATPKGIVRLEDDRFVLDERTLAGDSAVQFMTPTRNGLLIGVQDHLYFRRGDVITPIAAGAIPSGTMFIDGTIDRNGTVWVATRTGVMRIQEDRVEQIGRANGLLGARALRAGRSRRRRLVRHGERREQTCAGSLSAPIPRRTGCRARSRDRSADAPRARAHAPGREADRDRDQRGLRGGPAQGLPGPARLRPRA
jgi:ligand-binding sensor domain-containing protein